MLRNNDVLGAFDSLPQRDATVIGSTATINDD